ncbi:MAG TPA: PrsW family intramembrane metalloprotease [Firmicutes bacterium]|nr:PrsW family intramembrane metalloprotease [Bacillota bacterium]
MLSIIAASILPGIFWLWYFNRYDVREKEPLSKIMLCVLTGALAVLPALIWEAPFQNLLRAPAGWGQRLLISFFVVGLGEEFFKLLAVYLAVFRAPEFNEPIDGIIYSTAAAVGFSVVENVLYISAFGLSIAPLRGTIASLAHIAFSGLAGFYLAKARFTGQSGHLGRGLLAAAFLHGLYDFLLISRLASPFVIVVLVAFAHYLLLRAIRRAQNALG